MKTVRVRRWPPGAPEAGIPGTFLSEKDALSIRAEPNAIRVMDGNIVLAVFANMPVELVNDSLRTIDGDEESVYRLGPKEG